MPERKHSIELCKRAERHLNPNKITNQIDKIIERAMGGGRKGRDWTIFIDSKKNWKEAPALKNNEFVYTCSLALHNPGKRTDHVLDQDYENIIKFISSCATGERWEISFIDGKIADPKEDVRLTSAVGYAPVEIPHNWRTYFSHIYDRDNQIEIIMSSIKAAINSQFHDRYHVALVGTTSSGKTETLRSMKRMLGADAVLEYDATATTQAGAIKDLDSRRELPRIMIVEEIEKADENGLRWLLSVMDHRAEIRKTNYRESIQRETKLLTFATVNDYTLFNKIMYGALSSRFSYHIKYSQPTRQILHKILQREVDRVKGNHKWIEPALDYAAEENISDPRKIIAVCLCGRDSLLTGQFQKKLKHCTIYTPPPE